MMHSSNAVIFFSITYLVNTQSSETMTTVYLPTGSTESILEYNIFEEQPANSLIGNVAEDGRFATKYTIEQIRTFRYQLLAVQLLTDNGHHWPAPKERKDSRTGREVAPDLRVLFAIDPTRGLLTTTRTLDREQLCPSSSSCSILIDVSITPVQYFQIMKVVVHVIDINDNAPTFDEERIVVNISELAIKGSTYPIVGCTDLDGGPLGIQEYRLINTVSPSSSNQTSFPLPVQLQIINNTSNWPSALNLILNEPLDRETTTFYSLEIIAYDGGTPRRSGSVSVYLNITDANDNAPRFDSPIFEFLVSENATVGSAIGRVHATDADEGVNSRITYSFLRSGSGSGGGDFSGVSHDGMLFSLNSQTGNVVLRAPLDYERCTEYGLGLVATDAGTSPLSGYSRVVVRVLDLNDHNPVITVNSLTSDGQVEILENEPAGSFVAHLMVSDRDSESMGKVDCNLSSSGKFLFLEIGLDEYKIVSNEIFDREVHAQHVINVTCHDHGSPALTSHTTIIVNVLDVNDCTPEFPVKVYELMLQENNSIGDALLQLNVYDCDVGRNSELTYSLISLDSIPASAAEILTGALRVDQRNGTIVADTVFDYETLRGVNYIVKVADNGLLQLSATATLRITISDRNDNPPIFSAKSYRFRILENRQVGTEVGRVFASDADDSPFNDIVYRLSLSNDSGQFRIDNFTGRIFARSPLDREKQSVYRFGVVAEDANNASTLCDVTSVTIIVDDVNDNFPVVIFPTDLNRTVAVHSRSKPGSLITRILANDSDIANNSRLTFYLERQHDYAAFNVDADTGWIRKRSDFNNYVSDSSFKIVVRITDGGDPPKSVTTHVIIVVNDTLGVALSGRHDDYGMMTSISDLDFLALVSMTSLSLVTVVVMICVAYVVMRRQHRRRIEKKNRGCLLMKGAHSTMVVSDIVGKNGGKISRNGGAWNCRKAELMRDNQNRTALLTSHLYSRASSGGGAQEGPPRDHYFDIQYHSQLSSFEPCLKQDLNIAAERGGYSSKDTHRDVAGIESTGTRLRYSYLGLRYYVDEGSRRPHEPIYPRTDYEESTNLQSPENIARGDSSAYYSVCCSSILTLTIVFYVILM